MLLLSFLAFISSNWPKRMVSIWFYRPNWNDIRNELSEKNLKHSADCSFHLINSYVNDRHMNLCEICVLFFARYFLNNLCDLHKRGHQFIDETKTKNMVKNHKISLNDMWTIAVETLENIRRTQWKQNRKKKNELKSPNGFDNFSHTLFSQCESMRLLFITPSILFIAFE